jgi:hypothetical protein
MSQKAARTVALASRLAARMEATVIGSIVDRNSNSRRTRSGRGPLLDNALTLAIHVLHSMPAPQEINMLIGAISAM